MVPTFIALGSQILFCKHSLAKMQTNENGHLNPNTPSVLTFDGVCRFVVGHLGTCNRRKLRACKCGETTMNIEKQRMVAASLRNIDKPKHKQTKLKGIKQTQSRNEEHKTRANTKTNKNIMGGSAA